MKLLTRVYIKKECRDTHGINEAFEKAIEHIRKTYALFSLSEDSKVFILELHICDINEAVANAVMSSE